MRLHQQGGENQGIETVDQSLTLQAVIEHRADLLPKRARAHAGQQEVDYEDPPQDTLAPPHQASAGYERTLVQIAHLRSQSSRIDDRQLEEPQGQMGLFAVLREASAIATVRRPPKSKQAMRATVP